MYRMSNLSDFVPTISDDLQRLSEENRALDHELIGIKFGQVQLIGRKKLIIQAELTSNERQTALYGRIRKVYDTVWKI